MTTPTKTSQSKTRKACNAPDCKRKPTNRGLCDAHWATQRGLADPKQKD